MPRAVKRAIAAAEGARWGDQRAETGERRVILVNRIADLHRVVVYRSRAGSEMNARRFGTVMKVPVAGGTLTTLALAQNTPQSIAIDGTSAYWINAGTGANYFTDGAVMKVPVAGGTLSTLASGQGNPAGIAVDGTSVYWSNLLVGTVMRVTPKL